MGSVHHTNLERMLKNITDLIATAQNCHQELNHIKIYHNELSSEDLATQFRVAERLRHIEQIEDRIGECLNKLHYHQKTIADLIETEPA